MGSRSFSGQSPQVAHLAKKEVQDLRSDVEVAFVALEGEVDAITGGPFTRFTAHAATTGALPANTRTGNILEANANGALGTIDGVTLVAGTSKLLVKNEGASHLKHGLYLVDSLGSAGTKWHLTRVTELDADAEMLPNVLIAVSEGTVNADTIWVLTTNAPISINSTALTFALASISAANLAKTTGAALVGWDGAKTTVAAALAALTAGLFGRVVHGAVLVDVADLGNFTMAAADHTFVENDRVLCIGQTTGGANVRNGVYVVGADGSGSGGAGTATLTLASDWCDGLVLGGQMVTAAAGTTYAGRTWRITNTGAISVGVTAVTVSLVQSAADLAAAAGAAAIGITDAGGFFTGGTVEAALQEAKSIRVKQVTFDSTDLVALGGVKTGVIDVDTALPAGARLAGAEIEVTTLFQDVGDTATLVADLGTDTVGHEDWGVDGTANNMHTTGIKSGGTNVATFGRSVTAEQSSLKFTCSVNLDTLTAGEATARLWYYILP